MNKEFGFRIDKKYLSVWLNDHLFFEDFRPKFYIDWYRLKPNLKFYWYDCTTIHFEIGLFDYRAGFDVKFGYISRPKNAREKEMAESINKLVAEVKGKAD